MFSVAVDRLIGQRQTAMRCWELCDFLRGAVRFDVPILHLRRGLAVHLVSQSRVGATRVDLRLPRRIAEVNRGETVLMLSLIHI